jgi:quercetin dioxygenase-like cupin family protein
MKIKDDSDVPEILLEEEDIRDVYRKILIGPQDGSSRIVMRLFKVLPGGNTPYHRHPFEHVVKIEKGRGIIVSESEEEIAVSQGQNVFIPENEKHQFKNPYEEPFEFLCIIPNLGNDS